MRWALLVLLLAACGPVGPGGGPGDPPIPEDCADEDLVQAESCDDIHCGDPVVRFGSGGSQFEPIEDGSAVDLWFGQQGGYHIFVSTEMEQLCDIVFLDTTMQIDYEGELREIFSQTRHVQAVRSEESTVQQYWGIQAFVPCNFWPNDDQNDPSCGAFTSRSGFIDEHEIVITVTAEDHDGRIAEDSKRLQPDCCLQ